jgi:hypothetical protein
MTPRRVLVMTCGVLLWWCAGLAAGAQRGEAAALTPAQVERMWDQYVLAQAQTALNLNDQQFMRFRNRLFQLQQLRRRLQRERNGKLREAQQALSGRGAPVDQTVVMARLKEYDDLMVSSADQLRRAYASIDEVLNVRQRVRFRSFEDRMTQQKLELLAQARQAAGGK